MDTKHRDTAIRLSIAANWALQMQDAYNGSGVVLSFARHMQIICDASQLLVKGTAWKNGHPIVYLFAYKLLALAHAEPLDQYKQYNWAEQECKRIEQSVADDPEVIPDYTPFKD